MIVANDNDREKAREIVRLLADNNIESIKKAIDLTHDILNQIINGPFFYSEGYESQRQEGRHVSAAASLSDGQGSLSFPSKRSPLLKDLVSFFNAAIPSNFTFNDYDTPAPPEEEEYEDEEEDEDEEDEEDDGF